MSFDRNTRTFSGTPGRGDTDFFSTRSNAVALEASDGDLSTTSTFNIGVEGDSHLELALKIGGPIISVLTILFGLYKKRGTIKNCIRKKNTYQRFTNDVTVGDIFYIELDSKPDEIVKVKAIVEQKIGWVSKLYQCFGRTKMRDIPEKGLPAWLVFDSNMNTISSIPGRPNFSDVGEVTIQVFGVARFLLEQFKINVVPQNSSSADSNYSQSAYKLRLFEHPGNSENGYISLHEDVDEYYSNDYQ